ncbi:MAG: phosphodiester glycosidase family protein [Anaerolineales bacterium]
MRRKFFLWLVVILGLLCCLGLPALYYAGRPLPTAVRRELAPGVVYYRRFHATPNLMVAHIVSVDLNNPDVRVLVTPGDPAAEYPLAASTTSQFAREYGALVAINGDGFTPWYFNSLLDYYPHPGDPVRPNGLAASEGVVYSEANGGPVLYISQTNRASFNQTEDPIYNAIAGDRMLVVDGAAVPDLDDGRLAPRTAVGLDGYSNRLILIVIDGRQPLYSEGATLAELADLLIYYGATEAMSLDGGGSSTMVVRGVLGVEVMNSPIDGYVPGRERPVANHLGILVP